MAQAAAAAGYGEGDVPDLLGRRPRALRGLLLGQEELGSQEIEQVLRERAADRQRLAEGYEIDLADTERLIIATARKGQDRFAAGVMRNFGYACGFCGLTDPVGAARTLLRASHIKPWAECEPKERIDVRNGIAACANHDAAFDTGLLTVNGGLRIHRAPALRQWIETQGAARVAFGPEFMHERLQVPAGGLLPGVEYLRHHGQKWGWLGVG